jgi:hypothetical protein
VQKVGEFDYDISNFLFVEILMLLEPVMRSKLINVIRYQIKI